MLPSGPKPAQTTRILPARTPPARPRRIAGPLMLSGAPCRAQPSSIRGTLTLLWRHQLSADVVRDPRSPAPTKVLWVGLGHVAPAEASQAGRAERERDHAQPDVRGRVHRTPWQLRQVL